MRRGGIVQEVNKVNQTCVSPAEVQQYNPSLAVLEWLEENSSASRHLLKEDVVLESEKKRNASNRYPELFCS